MHSFLQTGIIGILTLLVTFVLFVAIVVALVMGNRKALLVAGLLGMLPLLLGVVGTALGYSATNEAAGMIGESSEGVIQEGYRAARLTTWLGAGCALGLWLVAFLGSLISKMARA